MNTNISLTHRRSSGHTWPNYNGFVLWYFRKKKSFHGANTRSVLHVKPVVASDTSPSCPPGDLYNKHSSSSCSSSSVHEFLHSFWNQKFPPALNFQKLMYVRSPNYYTRPHSRTAESEELFAYVYIP